MVIMVSDTTQVIWSLTTSGIFDPVTICRAEIAPDLHSEDPAAKGRRRGSNSAPCLRIYPLVMTNSLLLNMAIYGYLWWIFPLKMVIFPLKMVIFHSYVSLPEGFCAPMLDPCGQNGIEQVT